MTQKQYTHVWQCYCLTAGPRPPTRKLFLSNHSTRGSTLVGNPVNGSKTICRVVIPPCTSYTGGKLSAINTFSPRCSGLVYKGCIRVVYMIHGKLYENFLVRVKYERFKMNGFTLIFRLGWMVLKRVSSFLQRKACK